jgi:hypothetical protein
MGMILGRKNKYKPTESKDLNINAIYGGVQIEVKRGKEFQVRRTLDGESVYKCPGCNGEIPRGARSFTVIECDNFFGEQAAIDARRHWHEGCWKGYR